MVSKIAEAMKKVDRVLYETFGKFDNYSLNPWYVRILVSVFIVGLFTTPYYYLKDWGISDYLFCKVVGTVILSIFFILCWIVFIGIVDEIKKKKEVSVLFATLAWIAYIVNLVVVFFIGNFVGFDGLVVVGVLYFIIKKLANKKVDLSEMF